MRAWIGCFIVALSACSAGEESRPTPAPSTPGIGFMSDTVTDTAEGVWGTVEAPFEDVGLKQDPIPPRLQQIMLNPYAMPNPLSCDRLRQEIAELDTLLGPDICTPTNPTGTASNDYLQQGAGLARDKTVGFFGGKISLPFRGLVRRVSGAEKHAKAVELAYQDGKLRRAFLKGVGLSLMPGCLPIQMPAPINR